LAEREDEKSAMNRLTRRIGHIYPIRRRIGHIYPIREVLSRCGGKGEDKDKM
jgi:hypothetical protein